MILADGLPVMTDGNTRLSLVEPSGTGASASCSDRDAHASTAVHPTVMRDENG